jgi:hypothetical protein
MTPCCAYCPLRLVQSYLIRNGLSNVQNEKKEIAYDTFSLGSQGSTVGMATGRWLDNRGVGVRIPLGARASSPPHRPGGVKRSHRQSDH